MAFPWSSWGNSLPRTPPCGRLTNKPRMACYLIQLLLSCPDYFQLMQLSKVSKSSGRNPSEVIGLPSWTQMESLLWFVSVVSIWGEKWFFLSPQGMSCKGVVLGFIIVFLSGRIWCWIRLLFLIGCLKIFYDGFVDSSGAYMLVAPGSL